MKNPDLLAALILILGPGLSACSKAPGAATDSLTSMATGIPVDAETHLYKLNGFRNLVESGDELVVMVYGPTAREARIRRENIGMAKASLEKWLRKSPLTNETLLRVPDAADHNGSRFFYFQRGKNNKLMFIAVCSGPWKQDEARSPAVCDETVETHGKIVSIEYSEQTLLRNGRNIVQKVLLDLSNQGAIRR